MEIETLRSNSLLYIYSVINLEFEKSIALMRWFIPYFHLMSLSHHLLPFNASNKIDINIAI